MFGGLHFVKPGGAILLWTTEAETVPVELARAGFRLRETVPVPESRRRVIALYRRD